MMSAAKLLKLLLWLDGLGCAVSVFPLYMPASWMAAGHEWLGLGSWPAGPVAEHLARLTSGLYAVYGILVIVMATDVRRYAPLITAQAVLIACLGWTGTFFGWPIGIPKWWLIGDAAAVTGLLAATLILQRLIAMGDRRARPT